MSDQDLAKCSSCECTEDVNLSHDGNDYCDECFSEHYVHCDDCNDTFETHDTQYIESTSEMICNDCIERSFFWCNSCDTYCHDNDSTYIEHLGDICDACYGCGDYGYCQVCHENYHIDNLNYCQSSGDSTCLDCKPETCIHPYSYEPNPNFHHVIKGVSTYQPVEKKSELYFGVELEIDSHEHNENIKETSKEIAKDEKLFYCKDDGSLNYGFEIVSHPFSWDYFQNNKSIFKNALSVSKRDGFLSHDVHTCGMHIHVSKKALTNLDIFKIVYFVYSNPDFLKIVSNRNWSQINQYCSLDLKDFVYTSERAEQKVKSICRLAKAKTGSPKYVAINITKPSTIEFRIFRGTLNWITYQKNIQFVHSLVNWCKNTSLKEIQSANSVFSYYDFLMCNQTKYKHLVLFLFKKFYHFDLHDQKTPPLYKQMKNYPFYLGMDYKQLTKLGRPTNVHSNTKT